MNTIKEINENYNKIAIPINNDDNQDSQPNRILVKEKHIIQQTSQKLLINYTNNCNNQNHINNIIYKDSKDPLLLNLNKNLINYASSNIKNQDDNKSIYSTSKKGESSVYRSKLFNNKNNEKSVFGDSFDAGKQSLKDIIENVNKESKIFKFIDETIDFLNGDKVFLSNAKEEKDKYEMIEKNKYQKMKENNLELKQKKIQLTEEYNNLVKHINQVSKGIIGLKKTFSGQEKYKEEIKNKIYYQDNELKELNIINEKIHEMVLDNRMKKNNIVRALVKVSKKHHEKIPKTKKKLFEGIYNKNLEDFVKLKNIDKINSLKEKIFVLEEEVKIKNKECENVKMIIEKK